MNTIPHQRFVCAAMMAWALAFSVSCNRHAPESRVKSLEARIDGITCPTCVPPLTKSLKREYGKSAIEVDDDKDMATVRFAEGDEFSAAGFRTAVERVKMRIVALRLQACGRVDAANGQTWLTAGTNRFLVRSDRELPAHAPICADGTLDVAGDPAIFQVSSFRENSQ